MPQLRVSAGPSLDKLTVVATNYDTTSPTPIESESFVGQCTVRIRDFTGDAGKGKEKRATTESDYFDVHTGLTWSMQIQGRFKRKVSADDVLYGNVFEKPIRDHLPYGTAAALKFVSFVDPALEQDIYGDKPWALSPLIATMNYMNVHTLESADAAPPKWSSSQPAEDVSSLYSSDAPSTADNLVGNATGRRAYFGKKPNRQEVTFEPTHWIDMDFCNGFLDFNTFGLKLPGGLHFSLMKYWDGQPVTYICKNRKTSEAYFYIVFDIIDEKLIAEKAKDPEGQKAAREAESKEHKKTIEKSSGGNDDDLGVD